MNRVPVLDTAFEAPFTSVALILGDPTLDFSSFGGFFETLLSTEAGSGVRIGENTVLTARHVVDDLDNALIVTGSPSLEWPGTLTNAFSLIFSDPLPDVSNPNEIFRPVLRTQDLALITDVQGDLLGFIPGSETPALGFDVFLDHQEWIDNFGGIAATHAGFPRPADADTPVSQLFQSSGEIDRIVEFGQSVIGADVNFQYAQDLAGGGSNGTQPDGFIDAVLVPPFIDGTLDAAGGQSGGPLLTYDVDADAWRVLGVAIQSTGGADESAFFELITPDAFDRITGTLVQTGDAPTEGVTHRITGTLGEDRIEGSPFDDVIRPLGSTDVGDALFGGDGNDIYEFSLAYGDAGILESANPGDFDALSFPDLTVADIELSRDGGINLFVGYNAPDTGARHEVTILNHFAGRPVEEIRLSDGVISLTAGLELIGTELTDVFNGTPFDDIFRTFGGNDTLRGLAGDDIFLAGSGGNILFGGPGSDTYILESGFMGTIVDESGDDDAIFLSDLNLDDIRLQRLAGSGNAGVLRITERSTGFFADENVVSVNNHFSTNGAIERLVFADGSELDLTGGLPFTGFDQRSDLRGTEFGDSFFAGADRDFINAGGGDDFIVGETGNDVLSGGEGDDTYVFRPGDGEDTIIEDLSNSTGDTILLQGYNPGQLQIEDFFSFYVINLGADSIRVNTRTGVNPIEELVFADGGGIDFTIPDALENLLPNAVDDVLGEIPAGAPTTIPVEDLLTNDSDPDPDTVLQIVGVQDAQGGTVELDGGQITFTPFLTFLGIAAFSYLLSDGTATVPVTVNLSVVEGDGAAGPTDGDDVLDGTDGDDDINGLGGNDDISGGDGDDMLDGGSGDDTIDGDRGNDILIGGPGADALTGGGNADEFRFAPGDGADLIFGFRNGVDVISFTGLSIGFDDLGIRQVDSDAVISYGPGDDTITLRNFDATDLDPADFDFPPTSTNRAPNAEDDTGTVAAGQVLAGDVLANDSDEDGDALSVTLGLQAANGFATLEANGTFSYSPDASFSGQDAFTYVLSDGNGGSDTAAVRIDVTSAPDTGGGNDATIVATEARETHDAGSADVNIVFAPGTSQPGAVDRIQNLEPGDVIDLSAFGFATIGAPGSGFNAINVIVGNPSASGAVSVWSRDFSLIVENTSRDTVLDAIVIDGSAPPDPVNNDPVAVDDTGTIAEGEVFEGNVLANDSDADGDTLTATLDAGPANGTLTLNPDGSFSYIPDTGFSGQDSFDYNANDGNGGSSGATVSIDVTSASGGGDDANVITATAVQETLEGTPVEDVFVFDLGTSSRNDGMTDRIRGFEAGDEIDVSAYGFATTGESGFSNTNLIVRQVNDNVGVWNVRQDIQFLVENADRNVVEDALLLV